jgi:hypothetical protein
MTDQGEILANSIYSYECVQSAAMSKIPLATVVDLLNSDEPMGLSDRQIVELLESDE